MPPIAPEGLGWRDVARLGLVQVAIGAVAALMTSTLNRVMVVELALPAAIPSALVALHFAVQLSRPHLGFASDRTRRRAPHILAGAMLLAGGAALAAWATGMMASTPAVGIALAALAYAAIGFGLSAAGTALLAAVAERVPPRRLGAVAAVLWIMMIVGIAASAGISGALLDPFSFRRLLLVASGVGAVALALTVIGATSARLREAPLPASEPARDARSAGFMTLARGALAEPTTRRFAGFVFLAMLAFSAQDLILEPFAGVVFGMTPGESTRLGGLHHGGVLLGMVGAALASLRVGSLRAWAAGGCGLSGLALLLLAQLPVTGSVAALKGCVLLLGIGNGVFTVGGVGAMMAITTDASRSETGLRLGLFGAAQGMAYGLGSFTGGVATDMARWLTGSATAGYAMVFVAEAVLFAGAAWLALLSAPGRRAAVLPLHDHGDAVLAAMR